MLVGDLTENAQVDEHKVPQMRLKLSIHDVSCEYTKENIKISYWIVLTFDKYSSCCEY